MIHWQPAFEHHAHSPRPRSFPIRSGDVRACKSNDRSNAQTFFVSIFREFSTSLQDLAGSNRALLRKNHVHARCRLSPSTPASWSRGSKAATSREFARGAKSTCCESKNKIAKE